MTQGTWTIQQQQKISKHNHSDCRQKTKNNFFVIIAFGWGKKTAPSKAKTNQHCY